MPAQTTVYRVFIASPGGLRAEREGFRDVVQHYNHSEAFPRGVMFYPVGWEDTLGGVGRPQSMINDELRECDFCIVVLWDRWGQPTDNQGRFSSGTEEEFAVATECLADPAFPMQDIVVFFKAVDEKQLSDPGPQLRSVLDFKRTLEAGKDHLYHTFDEIGAFKDIVRNHLASWLRGHERGSRIQALQRPAGDVEIVGEELAPPEIGVMPPGGLLREELQRARELAEMGRKIDAEALLARAVVRAVAPEPLLEYGAFLERDGRYAQALEMYDRGAELAALSGDRLAEGRANHRLGFLLYSRGRLSAAETALRRSVEIAAELDLPNALAAALGSLGSVLYSQARWDESENVLLRALQLSTKHDNARGIADGYNRLGVLYTKQGRLAEAETVLREAEEINTRMGRMSGMAAVFGNLGLVLQRRKKLEEAELMHRKALTIYQELGQHQGIAKACANIGGILLSRGHLDEAEAIIRKGLEIDEQIGRPVGEANAYAALGRIYFRRKDLDTAAEMYLKSLEIDERIPRLDVVADSYERLAEIARENGNPAQAKELYSKAVDVQQRIGGRGAVRRLQDKLGQLEATLS